MAIIKIRNAAIDLDAAEIPNISASKITSGTMDAARIGSGTFADARIASSNVSQHATSFDDNAIVNDISTLALRQASNENKAAYNTNSMYVDVFQDDTGIASNTNAPRNASEYVSSIGSVTDTSVKGLWTTQIDNATQTVYDANIVDATGTLYLATDTAGGSLQTGRVSGQKAIRTAGWSTDVSGNGFFIREQSGQTSDLGFGTGAFTIEMFVKLVDSSYSDNVHQYVYDFNNGSNNRVSMAAYGGSSVASNAYNGNLFGTDGTYDWDTNFGVGNWRHIATSRDGSGNVAHWINGSRVKLETGKTANMTMTDSNELGIGHRYNGANSSHLDITDIRLSNVARYTPTSSSITVPTTRFTATTETIIATGNFISNAITAPSSVSSMGAIVTYQDASGTNTLNTDIVLQLSADNGSNFATATMTAMPNFASGIKMAKVNDLSVTAGTQLKYKISFANQSGSKEARIRGVSLQY